MVIPMDRAEIAVRNMLSAIEAPLYDVGVLGEREMLPRLAGIPAEEALANSRSSSIATCAAGISTSVHRASIVSRCSTI